MAAVSPIAMHQPTAVLHTMLRVGNLQRSLDFYLGKLGMRLLRQEDYPEGRFTLAFVGYEDECSASEIELTHNWNTAHYTHGAGFGHIALRVVNVQATCEHLAAAGVPVLRPAGPMAYSSTQHTKSETIAFVADPDGYRIELVESTAMPLARHHA